MNFNLVEMYNGLLRFNKHILNELAEGLKHLPNLDGAVKGDSLYINEQGNPVWGSHPFIPTFENAAYGIEWTKDDNDIIRIGNAKFHRELPIQNRLKGGVNHANVTVDNVNEKCHFIGYQYNANSYIKEWDFSRGVYFVPIRTGVNKKADYNWIRGNNGQNTDKSVRVPLVGGGADSDSGAGSGGFVSVWVRSDSSSGVGFFTTVKLD